MHTSRFTRSKSPFGGRLAILAVVTLLGGGIASAQVARWLTVRQYQRDLLPICRVQTSQKVLALTFDDGPSPAYTRQILRALKGTDARATFFVIGRAASAHPRLVRALLRAGMEVANHTWSHVDLSGLDSRDVRSEVLRLDRWLAEHAPHTKFVRAPFGRVSPDEASLLGDLGFRLIGWTIAVDHLVGDAGLTGSQAAAELVAKVRPGDIILYHDAPFAAAYPHDPRSVALRVLLRTLPQLGAAGYRSLTLSELLQVGRAVRARPRPWFWQDGSPCPD